MNEREEKEIELTVADISTVLKPSDSYALVLQEAGGDRKLALIIGTLEAQAIRMAQLDYHTPRPFTHDLMLDIFWKLNIRIAKAVIYDVNDGIYSSYLYIIGPEGQEFREDARTTDAISLSMREGFPLYIYDSLLEAEKLRNVSPDGSSYSVPVNVLNLHMLEEALADAVQREEYEKASELRDEIKRRKAEPPFLNR